MARVVDITEKLDFDSNPRIKIKDKEYEVNADAETVLKAMGLFGEPGGMTPASVVKVYELIFDEQTREEISKLKLQFTDFETLVMAAVNLITGENEEQGE